METYRRYLIRRLWSALKIPFKKKEATTYMEVLSSFLRQTAHIFPKGTIQVDRVDAMVCVSGAEGCLDSDLLPNAAIGRVPDIGRSGPILREDNIVCP